MAEAIKAKHQGKALDNLDVKAKAKNVGLKTRAMA